jgi:hypothetical protein
VAVGFDKFDEEKERERLRKLSDRELIREAAKYMWSPPTNFGKTPRDEFVIGLRLCQEEWHRRHPKLVNEQE